MPKPWRSPKLLKAAADVPCIRCGKKGETRACHFNGMCQQSYGKGRGQKCSDLMTAEFCHSCDQAFTEGHFEFPLDNNSTGKVTRAAEFLHWIAMTNLRRLERGLLKCS